MKRNKKHHYGDFKKIIDHQNDIQAGFFHEKVNFIDK